MSIYTLSFISLRTTGKIGLQDKVNDKITERKKGSEKKEGRN